MTGGGCGRDIRMWLRPAGTSTYVQLIQAMGKTQNEMRIAFSMRDNDRGRECEEELERLYMSKTLFEAVLLDPQASTRSH